MINIGSNKFSNVAIPLIFEDRYFLLEEEADKHVFTVFTFVQGQPVVEVLRNKPQANSLSNIETNPTGIITVSDPNTGKFLYKIRPGLKDSSIFGNVQGKEEEIKIKDRAIRFRGSVFSNNIIMGFPVGIYVMKDGGMAMGAPFPPEFQILLTSHKIKM